MFSKSIFSLFGVMIIAAFSASSVAANPLELGGPRIQVRVMPAVPAQPRVSEAINANFQRVHFDISNGYDDYEPLQSRDEENDAEDDDLDGFFGEDDPAEIALRVALSESTVRKWLREFSKQQMAIFPDEALAGATQLAAEQVAPAPPATRSRCDGDPAGRVSPRCNALRGRRCRRAPRWPRWS